ncbi:radical SAM domain protein [Bacteriovorax sp. BSW11_IV]|uniref:coproporphyrinogen-III oxidase family protein n=1 Tax=Bacteriovorax sp. BSW11_IV TaxID=1353529 RepID=UPI00038A2860|nr:coproporphyrinogen-III oxidase family protein [Bacteriovorax sp. BSW11_IV]EQC48767.1 radical SAM domain protein [Bacteriovorax sp. BSW11_IV]
MQNLNIDGLYIHFPFCRHLCNYCDFYKKVPTQKAEEVAKFENLLEESFHVHKQTLDHYGYSFAPLNTVYFGGGTPSLWGADGAKFLQNFFIRHNLSMREDGEFTLEVNPGSWTEEGLQAFREFGINRYSLGIQSLRSDFIKVLDRVHTLQDVYDTLDYFGKNDFNFSVDFMLGLPMSVELKRDVLSELEEILKYNPKHISLYILTVKGAYVHIDKLPDEEWIEKEYLAVSQYLKERGYIHYEVSNFSKPGFESKHNMGYWQSKSIAALGPSATGLLSEVGLRYKWKTTGPSFVEEKLSAQEIRLEKIYMALRTTLGLYPHREFSPDIAKNVLEKARDWQARGLAQINKDHIVLTSKGYLLLDSLMDDLFIIDKTL